MHQCTLRTSHRSILGATASELFVLLQSFVYAAMTSPKAALHFSSYSRHTGGAKRPEVATFMCGSGSVSEVREKGSNASDNGKQQEVQGFSCLRVVLLHMNRMCKVTSGTR